MAGKRAEIAAAVSTVPGVRGYTSRPSASTTGDAWPRWAASERDETSGQFASVWHLLVQLPAGDTDADLWVDEHRDALWDALTLVAYPYLFEPVDIGAGDGRPRIHGLMITMRSE